MGYTKEQLSLVSTGTLPSEVSEVLRAAAIERAMYVAKLRQFGFLDTSPDEGQQVYIWNKLNEQTDAKEVGEGAEPDYEDADATKDEAFFMKIMKAFKISWEADALKTINLRAGQTRAAVDKVFDYEDSVIMTRLEADRTSTAAGAAAWSTASADPVKDIRVATRTVHDLGYNKVDQMILHPANYEELVSIIASNTWYSTTDNAIKRGATGTIPFMGLNITQTTNASEGTATLYVSGANGTFMTAEAKKIGLNIFDDKDAQTTKVQVYERVVPCATVREDSAYAITSI